MEKLGNPTQKVKVGVVGARGYSGQELCRLLYQHPNVSLNAVFFNESKAFSLWEQFPEIRRVAESLGKPEPAGRDLSEFFKVRSELDVVFLATPNEVSLELSEKFLSRGVSVIDLSGVFRLNKTSAIQSQDLYKAFYGIEHTQIEILSRSVYGLHPFNTNGVHSLSAHAPFLIANPGCYVTSVLMAIIPLLKSDLLDESSIIIDAKSGASGAGKKLSENLLFSELYGDFYPYKVLKHQHTPEINMFLKEFSGKQTDVIFTPHLLPVFRGLMSSCYLKWSSSAKKLSLDEKKSRVRLAYESAFGAYRLCDFGELKDKQRMMSLKAVAHSNMTHLAYEMNNENLIVFSALDNLLKGAASQAIENFNCVYGFLPHQSLA